MRWRTLVGARRQRAHQLARCWFLDRIATHILVAEDNSKWIFFEDNYNAERMRDNAPIKNVLSDGFLVIRAPKSSAGTCVICS